MDKIPKEKLFEMLKEYEEEEAEVVEVVGAPAPITTQSPRAIPQSIPPSLLPPPQVPNPLPPIPIPPPKPVKAKPLPAPLPPLPPSESESRALQDAFREKRVKPPRFFNRYPMIVILFEPRAGGGVYAVFDRVGRFKKRIGLGFEYRLKIKKKRLPTSQFDNILESSKGKILMIDHPEEDVFRPMKIEGNTISPKETAWKETFMNNVERAQTLLMRKGFMEKYMPLVLLIVFGVMMIMALYVVRTDIAIIIDSVRSAASGAVQTIQNPNPPL